MLYCFSFQLIKGCCYLLWTENISSFLETLCSGGTRGTTTDMAGENQHYKQHENKECKNNIWKWGVTNFFPEMKVMAKWISPVNCHSIGNTLLAMKTSSFPTNWKLKSQLGVSDVQVVLHAPQWLSLLVLPAKPQARAGLLSTAGILHHFALGPQPFGSNLLTDCGGTEERVFPGAVGGAVPDIGAAMVALCRVSPWALCGGDAGESGWCCLQHRLCSALHTGVTTRHTSSTAPGSALKERFQAGKAGSLFIRAVMVLKWLQLS